MHPTRLQEEVLQRIAARRPLFSPFTAIDCARTALLVVDMQHGFVAPGEVAAVPAAGAIIPNINAMAGALRAAGGCVVYLQHLVDEKAIRDWSNYYENFMLPERVGALKKAFSPGSAAFELSQALEVHRGDLKIRKRRFGAFVPGSSDLHETLLAAGIDTLIVTGTVTNVCCESTARDAAMLNYKVFFIADGTAALTDQEHNATLADMACMFADVRSTQDMLRLIRRT